MGKIASFDEFKKHASSVSEDDEIMPAPMEEPTHDDVHGEGEHQYYMFFKNLSAIKHYISEIEAMDPDQLDNLLKGGHDWAADHIATSKDDIQEVAEWVRSEMEGAGEKPQEQPVQPGPENIVVDVEGDDDKVEVESGEGEKEEEEEEDSDDE